MVDAVDVLIYLAQLSILSGEFNEAVIDRSDVVSIEAQLVHRIHVLKQCTIQAAKIVQLLVPNNQISPLSTDALLPLYDTLIDVVTLHQPDA